jgi:hypothetical protein
MFLTSRTQWLVFIYALSLDIDFCGLFYNAVSYLLVYDVESCASDV